MNNKEYIKVRIEKERQILNQLAERYGLRHKAVLNQSLLLDTLINKYNKAKYEDLQRKQPIA
ncbi:Spo0E like sporulation regulatory protein [Fontibacillus phaseoli]|uniref:Spo0E like sporulation regulatory protein n=1 Tax=Fontibacillus phaseoli TaxID=1416533 RepID=A0A369B9P4_9BACL|nr:aspartyl-phosphate phosphatase Spo0E family protein [Fontibacillus phaseoli]RCX18242.1 Spo0E like sporulation regulatory protein [Fontibacillus phaseoli]